MAKRFTPLSAFEISELLGIDSDPDGEYMGCELVARMLDGETMFTQRELGVLASHYDMSAAEFCLADERFAAYIPEGFAVRLEIARKLINAGQKTEYAAEMCGVAVKDISKRRKPVAVLPLVRLVPEE